MTEGKTSPLNPVGGNDWLPDKKKDTKITSVEGQVVPVSVDAKILNPFQRWAENC
uniref:Uncharacterized protein n=1 Tax=Enterobacter cloacae TaxID=550 RepID=A0A1S6XY56_ENTCL|nr:hypothetical protein PIMI5_00051 [Enterobacter cloacae]